MNPALVTAGPEFGLDLGRAISAVGEHIIAGVARVQQPIQLLAVVHGRIGHGIMPDQLVLGARVHMVLVAEEAAAMLLSPRGDYDAEIMDTQTPQVSSSTPPEPMAATILQSSILRSFRMRAINWSCCLFPRKTTVGAPNQRQRFVELFPTLAQALVQTSARW